jgi:hypothetical protein
MKREEIQYVWRFALNMSFTKAMSQTVNITLFYGTCAFCNMHSITRHAAQNTNKREHNPSPQTHKCIERTYIFNNISNNRRE